MHIHVRLRHEIASVARRGSFSCARCKHWQRAEVIGVGAGNVNVLGGVEGARETARTRAARDADRMMRFATCPKCKQRSGLGTYAGRYALIFVAIVALMFLLCLLWPVFDHSMDAGDRHFTRVWMPLILDAVAFVILVPVAINEWRKLDRRVRWLDF